MDELCKKTGGLSLTMYTCYRAQLLAVGVMMTASALKFLVALIFLPRANKLSKVLFLAVSVPFLFVCGSSISGELLNGFAQIHRVTCLVPCSDEFECQGQTARSPGTKNAPPCTPITPGSNGMERVRCK